MIGPLNRVLKKSPRGQRPCERAAAQEDEGAICGAISRLSPTQALALAALATALAAEPRAQGSVDAQRWAFVPILISNAETGVQAGALVMRFLNPGDTLNSPSTVGFAARISQKAQVEVNLFPEWYLRRNLYHVTAGLKYIRWPADYYGLGNGSDIPQDSADNYLAEGVNGDLTVERKVFRRLSAGPQALFKYETIETKSARGRLTDTVPGHAGGRTAGLGGVITYDGRDAIYWARRGAFLRAKAAWYRAAWGSEFDYDGYSLEARRFLPVFATGAVGLSATLQAMSGDVPFRELSTADGDHTLRGLVRGKYRDRNLLLLQAEYKSYLPDWSWLSHPWIRNRLGYAAFAEAGQVARGLGDFAAGEFRPGFGLGLRYAMNPAQRMNIRVDVGFIDGSVAPAINIKEAF
ncbi:MAG TPA: BamA/TamA family outer membrane protein [Fibrobacteria bacterium]|nr:BamA/TamA family outer membrane protein [Fibrobacteria bacterium]